MDFIFPLVLAILVFGGLLYFVNKKFEELKKPADEGSLKMMMQVIADLRRDIESGHGKNRQEMEQKLNQIQMALTKHQTDTTQSVQKQLAQSSEIVQQVTKSLTELQSTNKQVVSFAEQMKSLENILKNPKQRGILGEYFLETLLKNVFAPGQYQMQYKFSDNTIVDAVVFMKDKVIPIDSKFSLENYNRIIEEKDQTRHEQLEHQFKIDLKTRIDETAKYIRPTENTTDFAFMFIPSEAVYYDLLINKVGAVVARDLIEYAFVDKKVIIVSPTSFLAYLQTVLQGLKALQIEESAKEIGKRVEELRRHLITYDEYFKKIGVHLGTTVNMYNRAQKELGKIDKDVLKITGKAVGTKPLNLESPETENENGE